MVLKISAPKATYLRATYSQLLWCTYSTQKS